MISGVYRGTVVLRRSERAAKTRLVGVRNGRRRLSLTSCVTCRVSCRVVCGSGSCRPSDLSTVRMAVVARPVAIGSIPLSGFERSATRRAVGFGTQSGARFSPAAHKFERFRARVGSNASRRSAPPRARRDADRAAHAMRDARRDGIDQDHLLLFASPRMQAALCVFFIQTTQLFPRHKSHDHQQQLGWG